MWGVKCNKIEAAIKVKLRSRLKSSCCIYIYLLFFLLCSVFIWLVEIYATAVQEIFLVSNSTFQKHILIASVKKMTIWKLMEKYER